MKFIFGGKYWPRGRQNFENREKYVPVLDSKICKEIEPKETPNARVNVIEMDELYSFVERKNRFYAITLISKAVQKNIDFAQFSTKAPQNAPLFLKNKIQAYSVEGANSDLKHYFSSSTLAYKTLFRSIDTMKSVF